MSKSKTDNYPHNENSALLDLYISEYNNLSERITYYLNIQSLFIAGILGWTATIIGAYMAKNEAAILWFGFLGFFIIENFISGFRIDQYNMELFIEKKLKPKVKKIVGDNANDFWEYQSYVFKKKSKFFLLSETIDVSFQKNTLIAYFRDFMPVIVPFSFLLFWICLCSTNFNMIDWIGLSLNILSIIILLIQTYRLITLRLEIIKK